MMQSTSEGCMNIAELAHQLRREKIFINSERQLLQKLNEEVEKRALELLQVSWICSMQRQNLSNLITSRNEAESVAACQRASLLERATFVDVHKVLKFKEANALAELLGWLRDSPHLVALCLLLGEEHMPASLPCALVAGLYGSGRSTEDRTRLLAVIRSLIKYQLVHSPDPRKMLRTSKCALSSLFGVVRDGHSPARQFLLNALQAPVMAVLHEDEFFLDIDPDKAMERFSPSDRLKKFGQPNSPEYTTKVARYRKWIVQSLYNLTSKMIASMREQWNYFPAVIAWIVQQIVHQLKQHSGTSERELHAICTELVLNAYICPAIVNPEAHGVVDVPVSYIARFNLIQIAQIVHVLSLSKHQEIEGKVRDVYAKFDRSCVWSLVDRVLQSGAAPPTAPAAPPAPLPPAARATSAALYCHTDAHLLITFLRYISSKLNNNTPSVTADDQPSTSGPLEPVFSESSSDGPSSSEACAVRLAALLQTMEPNYRSRLHDLLKKMPDFTKYRPTPPEPKDPPENGHITKKSILAKVPKPRLPRSASSTSSLAVSLDDKPLNGGSEREDSLEHIEVMVIKMATTDESDYVGLIPESKVLECYYGGSEAGDGDDTASALAAPAGAPVQKRTRFSVSHDEVSLGNTSDNLEAVSEAASNHSVTSSLELETEDQNDNLSDMVSANVSGRGSPNISGRETPSSQVTDGDPPGDAPPRRLPQNAPVLQPNSAQAKLLKQARNEIDDKFCKFEIKKMLEGDETISIMSDTWSTDVLASDSETIGDTCDHGQQHNPGVSANNNQVVPDVSETASESAWSMDVLASDSDRNTEVDTDDCVSVAARSDTSWPRRPSHQEDFPPLRLNQNGSVRRPTDVGSPRRTSRPNLTNNTSNSRSSGYQSATATLSRGGELDLPPAHHYVENRKSILVNGYPVMTCYADSGAAPRPLPHPHPHTFTFPQNGDGQSSSVATDSTLDANSQSDATSQWVDDSFPPAARSPPRDFPSSSKYEMPSTSKSYDDGDMDRSNSSESSFNAMSEAGGPLGELLSRMSIRKPEPRRPPLSGGTSPSERSSSQEATNDVTERRVSPPPVPKPSTGAIPKSISFDASAEKSQRRRIVGEDGLVGNLDELKNNVRRSGGNLLNKIKMFRQKGRQNHNHNDVIKVGEEEGRVELQRSEGSLESSEDILAKYRRKDSAEAKRRTQPRAESTTDVDRAEGIVDLNDPEMFNNMKRKLRMVLSNPDMHCYDYVPNRYTGSSLGEWVGAQAAWAGGAGNALGRALGGGGGGTGGARLAAALRADLAARRPYAAYLAQCRAALHHHHHAIDTQIRRVLSEGAWCVRAAAAARVLEQLERAPALRRLHSHHTNTVRNGGELMDEKAKRLTASIKAITGEVKADPAWEGASHVALEAAELTVERAAFARLYLHVLFPNGDGDIARDQVLSEHIRRLSSSVTASRLGVPPAHLWAAPYPHAQLQLRHLPVYRTPRDKVSCIMRCVMSIMSVLSLNEGAAPSADDLTPVLVYVILKVNPPSLLSTIELVNWAGGAVLTGEPHYWWTVFCAAVAYIKTMDYPSHT